MKTISGKNIQAPQLPRHLPPGEIAALEVHGEYNALSLSACDLTEPKTAGLLFEQVIFKRVRLGPSQHPRPRFMDCRFEACDLSAISWEQVRFKRLELSDCRLTGAILQEARIEDVVFKECKLDHAVFVLALFKAVRFERCLLTETSFESADLSGVVFDDCDLTRADLRLAKLSGSDLRGSRLGGVQVNALDLKGAIVDPTQAIQLASLIGLVVKEVGEE